MIKSPSTIVALLFLWLIGIALRLAILAVPPVIPVLRDEFNLSGTEIGALTGAPIVIFAIAALIGSRLVGRIGVVAAVIAGLLLAAAGCAGRAAALGTVGLFAATLVMGLGIGVTQPAMPALVGRWLPHRIVLGTGVYTNGLLVGEILPVAAFPWLYAASGDSWRATFLFWAVPTAVIGALMWLFVRGERAAGATRRAAARWWPDFPAREVWRLGLTFGGVGPLYFGSNFFLPGYLAEVGRPDLISPALTALNMGQLPASFLLIAFARRIEARIWPFVLSGLLGLAGAVALVTTTGMANVVAAAVLGFAAGAAFALALTFPPLMSAPHQVAPLSAAMFAIAYSVTVLTAVVCGFAWDITGSSRYAFVPIAAMALMSIVLVPGVRFDPSREDRRA